jgi:hypothetical protein
MFICKKTEDILPYQTTHFIVKEREREEKCVGRK